MANIKVLYVEDHEDTLLAISHILTRDHFDVVVARDCKSGIDLGEHTSFDVLVCDIGLPDGDGSQVLLTLRESKDFPAIALTGHGCEGDHDRLTEAGFDECITKPSDMSVLEKAITMLYNASHVA